MPGLAPGHAMEPHDANGAARTRPQKGRHLGSVGPADISHQFKPIVDGADRRGEIVAQPRRQQSHKPQLCILRHWNSPPPCYLASEAIEESYCKDAAMTQDFAPGDFVRHPDRPDWGLGQVQSATGNRVTVNFEDAGKQLINVGVVPLQRVSGRERHR